MGDTTDLEELELEPHYGRKKTKTAKLDISEGDFQRMVDERIQHYHNDFEEASITIADEQQIRSLAELSVLSELANKKVALMVISDAGPQDIKAVSDSAKALSAEARQLATSLGIDRKSRVTDEQSELETYLPVLHKEVQDFLDKRVVGIVCPHCLEQPARIELRMGHILWHFAYELKWHFTTQCPKCRNEFTIDQNNYSKFLFSELKKSGVSKLLPASAEDEEWDEDDS